MKDPAWLTLARSDIGEKETLGPNDSLYIRKMLAKLGAKWLLGQPWCGGAVASWMQPCGVQIPKNWFRAKAWLDWGVKLDNPTLGCVVVFERKGGGHVGLVVGRDATRNLMVLGGNQSDSVRISRFAPGRAVGYRWPTEYADSKGDVVLPVLAANGQLSTNEA